jgi:uncharacterized protein (TIGR03437 family)
MDLCRKELRLSAVGFLFATALAVPNAVLGQGGILDELTFEPIATGLNRPLGIETAGDGSGRLFVVLQNGQIAIHDGTQILPTSFLDIEDRVGCCNERGLLGLAFHPNFERNGYFYVNYTRNSAAPGGTTTISRFEATTQNPNLADPNSEVVLIEQDQPFSNHNGGALKFGPDGYLYIAFGDGGSAGDPLNSGQTLTTFLGKILRIDVDNGNPYSSPPTNPFFGLDNAQDELWAYGLRNPWRITFDRETGDLFIGDVGQSSWEEINLQPAGSPGGRNYGWRRMEGFRCFQPPTGCDDPGSTLPILAYPNGGGGSVTGGYRYRGTDYPQLRGLYFYADFVQRRLLVARERAGAEQEKGAFVEGEVTGVWDEIDSRNIPHGIGSFGEDPRGELLFAAYGQNGSIYRVKADYPVPQLTSLSPAGVAAGAADFRFTIVGGNFVPASEVRWAGEARTTHFVDSTRLQVEILADDVTDVGTTEITIFNPAPGGGATQPVAFAVEPEPANAPTIFEGGVGNAAGVTSTEGAAAGGIAATFGMFLAVRSETPPAAPLPTTLGGGMLRFEPTAAAELSFSGSVAVPEFFASAAQKNIQIPWELQGLTEAQITARVGTLESAPIAVAIVPFDPGIFSADARGAGQGSILIAGTTSLAAPSGSFPDARPVRRGEFIAIFCTGLGTVTRTPATGREALADPLSMTLAQPTVTVGGVEAAVFFSGLAPGFVGLYQVNVEIPVGVASGDSIDVVITIGGVPSNTVTIAVE